MHNKSGRFNPWYVICSLLLVYILYLHGHKNNPSTTNNCDVCTKLFIPIMDPSEISKFNMSDPILLNYLRARHLTPPSKLSYDFSQAWYAPGGSEPMARAVHKIFGNKKGGFFVEVGAFDGVGSNTLFLESGYNWSGLLIECHPSLIPQLRKAHRKSYIADVCLSTGEKPSMMEFISARDAFDKFPGSSSLVNNIFKRENMTIDRFNVTTVPLYSLLAAIEVSVVDFFVLDVQGIELKVLKSFPFNLIFVKVWAIEYTEHNEGDKMQILEIMRLNGYLKTVDLGGDWIFVHNSVKT